jgi:two-component system response regulator FixJ
MSSPDTRTVHLIDDDEAVREALTILLTEAGFTVRSHKSGTDFLDQLASIAPGCIVSDIRMPGIDGLELQQRLNESQIKLPLIFITGHGDVQMAVQAMRNGAVNFIEKPFDDATLIDAIELAFQSPQMASTAPVTAEIKERMNTLTPREKEVLTCLIAGKLNKIMAFELDMSVRTVEVHRARIMQKMQAHSLSELVRMVLSVEYSNIPTRH